MSVDQVDYRDTPVRRLIESYVQGERTSERLEQLADELAAYPWKQREMPEDPDDYHDYPQFGTTDELTLATLGDDRLTPEEYVRLRDRVRDAG